MFEEAARLIRQIDEAIAAAAGEPDVPRIHIPATFSPNLYRPSIVLGLHRTAISAFGQLTRGRRP